MRRSVCFGTMTALLAATGGCASMTRGTYESMVIDSDPQGANVRSSQGWTCDTPCSMQVKRKGDFIVWVTKEGFVEATATVTSSVDSTGAAGMAGNVLIGGIIGAAVDAGSGAARSHKPNPLILRLIPIEPATPATEQPPQPSPTSSEHRPATGASDPP